MATYVFKETQKFNQPLIWGILLFVAVITGYNIATQPISGWEVIIPLIIIGLVFALFGSMQLKTRIDGKSLSFSYFPLINTRNYRLDEIDNLELMEYNPIFKFGGWGIRYNFDMWAYNVRGKHGLVVHLKDKKFLLGTQKPEEIKKAIEQFRVLKGGNHAS